MIAYTKGELLDRYTIERRKRIYGADNQALLDKLIAEICSINWGPDELLAAVDLAQANDSIAVLEWQIRADHKLSDEEVGVRSREIRKINARRVEARNKIDGMEAYFTKAFDLEIDRLNLEVPSSAK